MDNFLDSKTEDVLDIDLSIFDDVPKIDSDVDKLELSSENYPYTLNFNSGEFWKSDKDLRRFCSCIEGIIRKSPEYRIWKEYLREVYGKYSCVFTGEINQETTVEIHHHPMTLYDMVKSVVIKLGTKNEEFSSLDVAKEVIILHYKNLVGYVPIVSSLHEKYHNGFLQIPIEWVGGNYKDWLKDYGSFLEEEDLEKIQNKISTKKEDCNLSAWKKDHYGDK